LRVTAGTTYFIAVDGYSGASGQIALSLNLAPIPTLAISVVDAVAEERGSVEARVRFALSNGVALPTTVNLAFTGTAQTGTDYTTSAGGFTQIVMPAGTTGADLRLIPVADTNPLEETETIIVTVGTSAAYIAPTPPDHTVALTLENYQPYSEAWLAEHPGVTANDVNPLGDADRDGVPSFLEYVANRNPLLPDGLPLCVISREQFVDPADGVEKWFAAIRFRRRLDAAAVPMVLEGTNHVGIGPWNADGVHLSTMELEGTGTEELLFRSVVPLASPEIAAKFYRMRVTLP
jgi:hypothetical protein